MRLEARSSLFKNFLPKKSPKIRIFGRFQIIQITQIEFYAEISPGTRIAYRYFEKLNFEKF